MKNLEFIKSEERGYEKRDNECKHLNNAGFRWGNDNCLDCGADLTFIKAKKT